eukprot:13597426-Alexandrium_andersonii.AAC.1
MYGGLRSRKGPRTVAAAAAVAAPGGACFSQAFDSSPHLAMPFAEDPGLNDAFTRDADALLG